MKTAGLEYGLRSRSTGKLVRLEERYSESPEYGVEIDRHLSFDDEHPYLQDADIGSIMHFKHGATLYGRRSSSFLTAREVDIDDLDLVEFSTTANTSPKGDPSRYVVEVSRLDFDFVKGVRYQFPPRQGAAAMTLRKIFSKDEIAAMTGLPSVEIVTLKSDLIDVARAGLSGSIIVPDHAGRAQLHVKPLGVVDVRTIAGVTYAAVTYDVMNPRFRQRVSLVDGADPHDQPWDDLKVSFGFDDSDERSVKLLEEIWDDGLGGESIWPEGWSIDETDTSGARMVVVFRIEGPLREEDGRVVRSMLHDISALRDPREGASAAPVPGRR
jgi:hypothetical protein